MADEDDPYDGVATGGLRLKGEKLKRDKKKKKKKKNKAKEIFEEATKNRQQNDDNIEYEEDADSSSNEPRQQNVLRKTPAEIAFEKAQEKRAAERILGKASKTHKQRVEELNDYLGGLSEHYDIQKVSWTK